MVAIASPNGLTWYLSLDQFEEEESVVVHDRRLPLYLNSHKIEDVTESISVSSLCKRIMAVNMTPFLYQPLSYYKDV